MDKYEIRDTQNYKNKQKKKKVIMVKLPCILSRYCVKKDEKEKRKKKKEKNKREKKKRMIKGDFVRKGGRKDMRTIVCYLDNRTLFFLHFISLYVYGGHVDFV